MLDSSLTLAALATTAIPGFRAAGVRPSHVPVSDCDVVDVLDAQGQLWTVRAPRTESAGSRMEREITIWNALHDTEFGKRAVGVPRPLGFTDLENGTRCAVYPRPEANPMDVTALTPESPLLEQLCGILARLHRTTVDAFKYVDIPKYTAEEYRQKRLNEVNKAIQTGSVPQGLVDRWLELLSPGPLWNFEPVIIHGDLVADHVMTFDDDVKMITGWSETKIADPADDLAWLLAGAGPDIAHSTLETYELSRGHLDDYLLHRARLAGELSVVRWLLHGSATDNIEIMKSARIMLRELDQDIALETTG